MHPLHSGSTAAPTRTRPLRFDRSRRVALLLVLVAVLSGFDLAFTQVQLIRGNFLELNAIAAATARLPGGLAVYKLALVSLGMTILYKLRRHWQAEAATAIVLACHAGLMVWWLSYLKALDYCLSDPTVTVETVLY